MEMKVINSLLLSFFLSTSLYAQVQSVDDSCQKASGHWQGIYTLKNENDCKNYNGCTHLVTADVTYIANHEYHLSLHPVVGIGGEFDMYCDKGIITSPIPNSTVSFTCYEEKNCSVIYNDSRLTSEMTKN